MMPLKDYLGSLRKMWGAETAPVSTIISALKLAIDGAEISVPFSAYADLGDPHRATLRGLGNEGFALVPQIESRFAFPARTTQRAKAQLTVLIEL
jgi:hypothetical protein